MEIIIAEDEFMSRKFLKNMLEKQGHYVMEAQDGQEAWELYQKNNVNFVISDWIMPKMDGLTLCRNIRSFSKDNYTYLIILTAKDNKEDLVEVFHSGADDYVAKPFDIEELKSRIKTGERVIHLEGRHKKLQQQLVGKASQVEEKNQKLQQTLRRLEETQSQILQSEKMASIGQLAAGVAHEINNPTGFVSSNLKTLSDYQDDLNGLIKSYQGLIVSLEKKKNGELTDDDILDQIANIKSLESDIDIEFVREDISDLIGECREGTERIKKIVIDLKDFAHPGEDKIKSTNINSGLESTLNVVNNELKYKATIKKDFGEISIIKAYPQQLNQVFMNMLVNAGQAIEKQGEITIRTRQLNGNVEISIGDTGGGIPKEKLSKIFDPFFTTKDIGQGTGLGLNIAYNIIKKHKGTIDVESKVGEGTTFTIQIPSE